MKWTVERKARHDVAGCPTMVTLCCEEIQRFIPIMKTANSSWATIVEIGESYARRDDPDPQIEWPADMVEFRKAQP